MAETDHDDAPQERAGECPADRGTITRRGLGKTTLGVVAAGGLGGVVDLALGSPAQAGEGHRPDRSGKILGIFEARSVTGAGNNPAHPDWGVAESIYPRVAPSTYVDGRGEMPVGLNGRFISNRIFNDMDVNIYSARNISTWGFVWGQFVDHSIAMRRGRRQTGEDGEPADIPTTDDDPMEQFHNDMGVVFMNRSIPAPGTGETSPREQINMISSYLDASTVYGGDAERQNWLREGPADGNPAHSGARMLMQNNYLPTRAARGNPDTAPAMVTGAMMDTSLAFAAGDHRANENPMLTSVQTLFVREHNRIVARLPRRLSEEDKFQIARAVVIAKIQYITYNEFLPALGVRLPRYTGYKPHVKTAVTNEFATIGFRAHSMISRALEVHTEARRYDQATLDWFKTLGVQVTERGSRIELVIPHGFATFFEPRLVPSLGLGPTLQGVGLTPMTRNDELVINRIRSLLANDTPDFQIMNDLTAVDIHRGRDHGLASYNEVRKAYGLAPKHSFRAITGEASEDFPADPLLTPGNEVNELHSLDWVQLYDLHGRPTTPEAHNAVRGVRRTPLAARLKAIYGTVDKVDAIVGMMCEKLQGDAEFGELQLAIWKHQFTALRDGDRFFYANNPLLEHVRRAFGIDFRTTLGDLIARNTDIPRHALAHNVFFATTTPSTTWDAAEVNRADSAAMAAVAAAGVVAAGAMSRSLRRDGGLTTDTDAMAPESAEAAEAAGCPVAAPANRKMWFCGRAEF